MKTCTFVISLLNWICIRSSVFTKYGGTKRFILFNVFKNCKLIVQSFNIQLIDDGPLEQIKIIVEVELLFHIVF